MSTPSLLQVTIVTKAVSVTQVPGGLTIGPGYNSGIHYGIYHAGRVTHFAPSLVAPFCQYKHKLESGCIGGPQPFSEHLHNALHFSSDAMGMGNFHLYHQGDGTIYYESGEAQIETYANWMRFSVDVKDEIIWALRESDIARSMWEMVKMISLGEPT